MPYAMLTEVFPGTKFSGPPEYLNRVNVGGTIVEPFSPNGFPSAVKQTQPGYGLAMYKNQANDPYFESSLTKINPKTTESEKVLHKFSEAQKSIPRESPVKTSVPVPGKAGGDIRVKTNHTPEGIYFNDYQSYDTAFNVSDITANHKLGVPLRTFGSGFETESFLKKPFYDDLDRVPTAYISTHNQNYTDYASYLTPAMEEDLARETSQINCRSLFSHLRNCKECRAKVAKLVNYLQANSSANNFSEFVKTGFKNFFDSDSEGFAPISNAYNYDYEYRKPTVVKKGISLGDILEIVSYALMGIFLIFVMNVFVKLGGKKRRAK